MREEKEESFRNGVVRSVINVGPPLQDLLNPLLGLGELVTPAILVKETQDVTAHHWIDSVLEVGEKGLQHSNVNSA